MRVRRSFEHALVTRPACLGCVLHVQDAQRPREGRGSARWCRMIRVRTRHAKCRDVCRGDGEEEAEERDEGEDELCWFAVRNTVEALGYIGHAPASTDSPSTEPASHELLRCLAALAGNAEQAPSWVRHNAVLAIGRLGPPPTALAPAATADAVRETSASVCLAVERALQDCIVLGDPVGKPAQTGVKGGSSVVRGCASIALQRWRWLLTPQHTGRVDAKL